MPTPSIESDGVTALDAPAEALAGRPFVELVAPLIPAAQRLAFGMLQNAHECEDAVQDATFKAWRTFPRFRVGSNVRAWFLTIVANECRQRRRSRWWSIVRVAAHAVEDSAAAGLGEDAIDLRSALNRLPSEMKLALVLRYYLDLPFAEVGRVLHVSEKAAKARVHRALARLRIDIPEIQADA